ncbi:LamG-like jellyroll fold domain-containing protein [Brumimicrobium aurantiacum]|uniref:T9SS C-terminal target domain-containing protein n=1 Tax=Brumimicrobium aurantiacum TaxID=1737063 RepID=A0A3E1EXL4_9FLAO|nr:LamG-like jellyroll fold domain-containing protein [Brumimicrobium aurantiacum]RFC54278.1 T9SS C-terminal target domain-containing protein [Brumimicrobium aurantiacum]
MKKKLIYLAFATISIGSVQGQNALNLDGFDDHINTNLSGISGDNARTVEAWVKIPNANTTSQNVIVDWGVFAISQRSTFNVLNNRLRFEVGGAGQNGMTLLNDDTWHHVAYTYDPSDNDTVRFYVDGVADGKGRITTVNSGTTNNIRIGQRLDNNNNFAGSIDEVRIWNYARTASEISANMNTELCNQTNSLIAYFNFNEGTPGGSNTNLSSVLDLSSNLGYGNLSSFALTGSSSNFISGPGLTSGMSISAEEIVQCNSYTWPVNNTNYTTSGTYIESLTSSNNCDSIVTLNLTIVQPTYDTITMTACEEYIWNENGTTYTTSGVYSENYSNIGGCDSIKTLDLTIGMPYDETVTAIGCNEYYWDVNGETYTSSGNHTEVLQTASGCDSTITLDLSIVPLTNTVSMNEHGVLKADRSNISYQWIDCDTEMEIPGATNQEFEPTYNGSFKVVLDNGDCTDTSICLSINNVSVNTFKIEDFAIYPNPSNGSFKVEFNTPFTGLINITNISGKQIYNSALKDAQLTNLNLTQIENGIYFININDEKGNIYTKKVILE